MTFPLSFEALERLIAFEKWFYDEYSREAKSSSNAKAQKIYSSLAKIEERHVNLLSAANSILFPEEHLNIAAISSDIPIAAKMVMDTSFKSGVQDLFFKLEIHLRTEEEQMKIFNDLAATTENERARVLFEELASDETAHRQVLSEFISNLSHTLINDLPSSKPEKERVSREQMEARRLARMRVAVNRPLLYDDPTTINKVATATTFRRAREAQLQLPPCCMCNKTLERSDPVIQCDYCGEIGHLEHPTCNRFFEYRDNHKGNCPKCGLKSTARVAPEGVDQLWVPSPFW